MNINNIISQSHVKAVSADRKTNKIYNGEKTKHLTTQLDNEKKIQYNNILIISK